MNTELPLFQADATQLFVIKWENMDGAGMGTGTKQFPKAEAEALAEELNEFKPSIRHWIAPAPKL